MKKSAWLIGAAALCVGISGLAYASNPIQLAVNGKTIETDVPPEIKDGHTMVPVRSIAEALGAKVNWNEERQTVRIESDWEQQISLLQQGYASRTPQEAAQTWAEAVKNRNGAVQFAVLSPELKEQTREHYERIHWVTGISSPWVERFQIADEREAGEHRWEFDLEFQMKTSTGSAGLATARLTAEQIEGTWYITQVLGGTDGVPNVAPDDIRTDAAEVRAVVKKLKLDVSQTDIGQIFGQQYAKVVAALDGSSMWRYDFVDHQGYTAKAASDGTNVMDDVDRSGLESGALRMQLFVEWDADGRVREYSLYYLDRDGSIANYRLYADGKIQLK